jgi:hypothetical protein
MRYICITETKETENNSFFVIGITQNINKPCQENAYSVMLKQELD